MSDTKIGLVRQFGSEQFSMTITLDSVASEEEVTASVESLHLGVSKAFAKVLNREEKEKKQLIEASRNREESSKALEKQIEEEMKAATSAKYTVAKVERFVKKNK